MDGFRFSPAARLRPAAVPLITRRQTLKGVAGGLALALASSSGLSLRTAAARSAETYALTNPASRVLLPGEAGLDHFGLDFNLSGPPAVFFSAGDTPGWSDNVKSSVNGFLFGYSSTLTRAAGQSSDRAVQVCVHHGFPSESDADIAWSSLVAALASSGSGSQQAQVQSLDLVELVVVEGQSIMATLSGGQLNAVVLASRSGDDLVTVAISDASGNQPTADEALSLANSEGKKLELSRQIERTDVKSAFNAQWTPGFQLGSASGAPFFAWPTFLDSAPVAIAGESSDQLNQRQQTNRDVAHQSHVEGPLWENSPVFDDHTLYFSAQSNFFSSSKLCKSFHSETESRLQASMVEASITKIQIGNTEKRLAYQTDSSYGTLSGITLHRIVIDADFPVSLTLHVVAVPNTPDTKPISVDRLVARIDIVIRSMRNGMQNCLVSPQSTPLIVQVDAAV